MMNALIDCFIPYADASQAEGTVSQLKDSALVNRIFLLTTGDSAKAMDGCEIIKIDGLTSTESMIKIATAATAPFTLLYTKYNQLVLGYLSLERFVALAKDSGAAMLYSDHYAVADGKRVNAPVIDYQFGSLRDDFDFGSLLFFSTGSLKEAVGGIDKKYSAAGLYDLRLRISRVAPIVHINEYLYDDVEIDNRRSGEKIFDYVDPKNRSVQIEMEDACTAHLKAVGGYLAPVFDKIDFNQGDFENEASVVIPVRNRVRTIRDAIECVLAQKTDFPFNLIIVDNHSTDGTTEAIEEYKNDPRLIHIVPERKDLGIGGCWNLGAHHPKCGKFAVQLDSDDVYSDENTLATVVKAFYEQNCGMVVGTYMLTDINKQMIPPGVIDHKEWTPENGRNNALRINGLGAPRAFYTPLLRKLPIPNTSYGEDYAEGLAVSRDYQIGRIWHPIYLCRRWEDNSDAALDRGKMNANNLYKDRIRTWELLARIAKNNADEK